jgi:hypothetical protein
MGKYGESRPAVLAARLTSVASPAMASPVITW